MKKFKTRIFLMLMNSVYSELPLEQMQEIRNDCSMKCKLKEEALRAGRKAQNRKIKAQG